MSTTGNAVRTILFIHSNDDLYGADVILLQLVELLDRQRFRPIVVLPKDVPCQGLLSKALKERKIATLQLNIAILRRKYFTPVGLPVYLIRLIISTLVLIKLIRYYSVDIVHSNTIAVIPGAFAAWFTRRPHIWHVLEIIVRPRILWRITSWLLPRLSQQIVAASGPTRDHLCKGDPLNQKAIVIHNGVDLSRFDITSSAREQIRAVWGIQSKQLLVGMIGRVSRWKGQDYFLRVAKLVIQHHPEVRFALVGGTFPGQEHLKEELQTLAKQLDIDSMVIFDGFRSDIPAILSAYDIFVLPSTLPDPFPTVILEAMAAGKPVIANAHGGSVELIDHQVTGILVDPQQPCQMAQAIEHLLDNPIERSIMGQKGRERVQRIFTLDKFITSWIEVYEQVERDHTTCPY